MTVEQLINELKKWPLDMPVAVDDNIYYPPDSPHNKLEVSKRTWVVSNYPYTDPDFDYINIE